MLISRRTFSAAALSATLMPALHRPASAQEMIILRRPARYDEDPVWYQMGQMGPHHIVSPPLTINMTTNRAFVYAPRNVKTARLVVFSHAALTPPSVYELLLQHIASHGYVVFAPDHDDSIFQRGLLTRRAAAYGSAVWDVDRVLNDILAWDSRAEACRAALEHVDLISQATGIDVSLERPIIMGHEFGALVSMVSLGATVTGQDGKRLKFSDDRWFGGIFLSPQGTGVLGFDEHSWDNLDHPFMSILPELETDFTGQTAEQKLDAYKLAPGTNHHLIWFPGATNNFYAGPRVGNRPKDVTLFEDLKSVITGFLKCYSDYDSDLFAKFASDWPNRASEGRLVAYCK